MRSWPRCLGLFALALTAASGCAARRDALERRFWASSYALGAFGGGEIDLRDVCESGKADAFEVHASWTTLAISIASLGVYTPREVVVRCRAR